ncbi:hypothetical protein F4776DRAFT_568392 [Hypoxylon sp. NC0597]|nr:hypothetical protein F4776DRAFT_568392 [Hypoxylon sp. NC0597]
MENQLHVLGMRYQVRNLAPGVWQYVEDALPDVRSTVDLLVRVVIAKVTNEFDLVDIFRGTPVLQNNPSFNFRTWVIEAVLRISRDRKAVGTAQLNWAKIENCARSYVADKIAAGRFGRDRDMRRPKPTWDMLEGREIIP